MFSFFRLLGFVHRGERCRWHTPLARARISHLPVILLKNPAMSLI